MCGQKNTTVFSYAKSSPLPKNLSSYTPLQRKGRKMERRKREGRKRVLHSASHVSRGKRRMMPLKAMVLAHRIDLACLGIFNPSKMTSMKCHPISVTVLLMFQGLIDYAFCI